MKSSYQFLLTIFTCLAPITTFAFFCPTNFNQIQAGDSTAQVTAQCGKPDNQKESMEPNDSVPQQWSYFAPQQSLTAKLSGNQGSVQVVMSFDAGGNLINMMVNNVSVSTTTICGTPVQLGETRDRIKSICGTPSFINRQTQPAGGGESSSDIKTTQFFYNTSPPATLIFENDKLKERK